MAENVPRQMQQTVLAHLQPELKSTTPRDVAIFLAAADVYITTKPLAADFNITNWVAKGTQSLFEVINSKASGAQPINWQDSKAVRVFLSKHAATCKPEDAKEVCGKVGMQYDGNAPIYPQYEAYLNAFMNTLAAYIEVDANGKQILLSEELQRELGFILLNNLKPLEFCLYLKQVHKFEEGHKPTYSQVISLILDHCVSIVTAIRICKNQSAAYASKSHGNGFQAHTSYKQKSGGNAESSNTASSSSAANDQQVSNAKLEELRAQFKAPANGREVP